MMLCKICRSYVVLGSLLGMVILGCEKPTIKPVATPLKIATVQATSKQITDYDEFVGRTGAIETVEVRARVTGYVKQIHFSDGQMVQEDDLLFSIEPDVYQAAHQQALAKIELMKARVGLAKSKLARAKSLIDVKAISQEEYEENVAALTEAQAQETSAQADSQISALDLKYTEVRSPISGRIDRALITPGNIVTGGLGTGTLLTTIVKNDPMFVYFDVDEQSVLRYQRLERQKQPEDPSKTQSSNPLKSQEIPCFVQLGDEKDFPHRGKLDFLQNRIDDRTGSIKLRALLDNKDNLLKSGMFVRIRVPVSQPYDAVLVPEASIGVDQDTRYVIAIGSDKKPVRRTVELGRSIGTWRVITKGLDAGTEIVYRGLQRVRPGAEISIEQASVPLDLDLDPSTEGVQ
ncbi:MAG: efflux RND transporter periplasmic adaptor subunit [Planctomycetaceae bacterium]|jgi:RND family efflux transporter MFP subunit|nr:efflux RND transporter periplasmic adaptor subunit [Planctomycetaceae bacterium]